MELEKDIFPTQADIYHTGWLEATCEGLYLLMQMLEAADGQLRRYREVQPDLARACAAYIYRKDGSVPSRPDWCAGLQDQRTLIRHLAEPAPATDGYRSTVLEVFKYEHDLLDDEATVHEGAVIKPMVEEYFRAHRSGTQGDGGDNDADAGGRAAD